MEQGGRDGDALLGAIEGTLLFLRVKATICYTEEKFIK